MALRDVIGQTRAVDILMRTLARGRIPSAYLFVGESGIGKRFTALNLAKAVNCVATRDAIGRPDEDGSLAGRSTDQLDACDFCESCRKVQGGIHPDVLIVEPEKGEIRADEIRQVSEALSLKAFEGARKVVVIDGAEAMNQSAANAFLKTLEEPPPETLIILVSSSPDRLPETIRSRCSQVRFKPLPVSDCLQVLARVERDVPMEELSVSAGLCQGRPGLLISTDTVDEHRRFAALFASMVEGGQETWADRDEIERWIDLALIHLRDAVVTRITGDRTNLVGMSSLPVKGLFSAGASEEALFELYRVLRDIRAILQFNLNKAITWNYTASLVRPLAA